MRMASRPLPLVDPEIFPPQYTYPPFYTRQPNASAWAHQRSIWAGFILKWCRAKKVYRMGLGDALETELFWNKKLGRRLSHAIVVEILDTMATEGSVEWAGAEASGGGSSSSVGGLGLAGVGGGLGAAVSGGAGKITVIVWWRKPEEWANMIYDWIDSTGQKNTVLTLHEISEGDLTVSQEFHGMDPYCLRRSLEVLTKRGVAQIFSINDEFGIKFF